LRLGPLLKIALFNYPLQHIPGGIQSSNQSIIIIRERLLRIFDHKPDGFLYIINSAGKIISFQNGFARNLNLVINLRIAGTGARLSNLRRLLLIRFRLILCDNSDQTFTGLFYRLLNSIKISNCFLNYCCLLLRRR